MSQNISPLICFELTLEVLHTSNIRVTGNQNARGWGQTGSNGANCTFTAIEQALNGNVLVQGESEWTITVEAYEA